LRTSHGLHMGKVVDKFQSATGDAVYDIKLIYSPFRVAALEDNIVFNYGPPGHLASRQA